MFWPLMKDTITWGDRLKLARFVLFSDRFTKGPVTTEFEEEWSRWLGVRHSLFVSSGSTANFLLLAALKHIHGWNDKTNILVPVTTWTTGVAPIIQLGMNPVFADISLENFGIDAYWLSSNYHKMPKIDAVFYPHLLGLKGDDEFMKTFFPDAILIEDLCESHGLVDQAGHKIGTSPEITASTFSFYYGHHMTTMEGGMVSTNDQELYNMMKMMRSHGLRRELTGVASEFLFEVYGYNFRNTDLGATLGLSQLKRLDDMIDARSDNFYEYMKVMDRHRVLFFTKPSDDQIYYNSSFCFPFVFRTEEQLQHAKRLFKFEGIETRPIIAGNLLRHPAYSKFDYPGFTYMNADVAHYQGIYIGNNHFLKPKHFKTLDKILGRIQE